MSRYTYKLRQFVTRLPMLYRYCTTTRIRRRRLKAIRNSDTKENLDTQPPPTESISLVSLWAAEFYSPALTDDLIDSFRRLGWKREEPPHPGNPIAWLEAQGESYSSGVLNLGILVSDTSHSDWHDSHTVPLPEHVEYATAHLFTVTPSLHCLVVGFVIREGSPINESFMTALRREYRTRAKRDDRGWIVFHRPRNQKHDRINQIRSRLSEDTLTWFDEYFPGLCASGLLHGEIPTWELITTRVAEPFREPDHQDEPLLAYELLLNIAMEYDVWQCESMPGLKLRLSFGRRNRPRYHSILAIREPIANGGQLDSHVPVAKQIHVLDGLVPYWISTWGIVLVLKGYSQHMRALRAPFSKWNVRRLRPSILLRMIEARIVYSADISSVVTELLSGSQSQALPLHYNGNFQPCDNVRYRNRSLASVIERIIDIEAQWIHTADRRLREQLSQLASALGAAESIRLQRVIKWLTILLTVIALITLVFGLR